jgi:hypothetical protein
VAKRDMKDTNKKHITNPISKQGEIESYINMQGK